ncbi:MAG: DUF1549 domain-containing protein [Planctomycetales bacterium]
MKRPFRRAFTGFRWFLPLAACVGGLMGMSACAQQAETKPAQPKAAIDFAHDIAPLIQKRCAKCHIGSQKKGGLSLNTRQTLLAGGDDGPVVVSKKSSESPLMERLESDDPGLRMPPEGERLNKAQIDLVRRWIDQGLPWEEGFAFGKSFRQAPIEPRRPAVPASATSGASSNPIDRFLAAELARRKVDLSRSVSDQVFARRVGFDLAGLPPTPEELAAFEADRAPDKRERLVDRLMADQSLYAAHWLTFWNDLLRNAYHGTGFIDGGRKQVTGWLYAALYDNKPYDRFVHELVSPPSGGGSEGFTYGIKWRGTVNESQRREIQAAQSVSQVFLGTNLKCASCHDSFVNHWKLTDAYALSSVFADAPLELHRCDQPTGTSSTVAFLYPQVGTIDPQAPREARMRQLADLLVHPNNGRLARTIVNRLWARLFGRGLVEPLDNLDAEPWNQDLLDFLASDLADNGYDLKRTLRRLATSRAYQLPAVARERDEGSGAPFEFRGPFVKRLMAEQYVDAVYQLTSQWPTVDPAQMKVDGRGQGGQLGAIATAIAVQTAPPPVFERLPLSRSKWIWNRPEALQGVPPETIFFRRVWKLDRQPSRAIATVTVDNAFELFVNGQPVAKSENWNSPVQVDVARALQPGNNVIALRGTNGGNGPNAAGAIVEILALDEQGRTVETLVSDETWVVAGNAPAAWVQRDFDAASWKPASVLGDATVGPWNVAEIIRQGGASLQTTAQLPAGFRLRCALLPLDQLQAALGRPNREQVVTARDAAPTMLQALELTNGVSLQETLRRGAEFWQSKAPPSLNQVVDRMYITALSRPPTPAERKLASEIIGSSSTVEGIEDLLWTLCMHPEFQLVP